MTDFAGFLKKQTPLCLGVPFYKYLVSQNLYYTLSERSEADFNGRNLFEQGCPNARICDGECIGRPIPDYPEISHLMPKYGATKGTWGGKDVWLIQIDTCKTCPFKDSCSKMCPSMSAFDGRNKNKDDYYLEMATPLDMVDDAWLETLYDSEAKEEWYNQLNLTSDDIVWDCLSEPQKAAVMMILVQGKTFEQAATARGINVSSVAKSYESGMSKLKEFGLARKAIKTDFSCKFSVDYYLKGLSQPEISIIYGVNKSTVSRKILEFKEKHGISD